MKRGVCPFCERTLRLYRRPPAFEYHHFARLEPCPGSDRTPEQARVLFDETAAKLGAAPPTPDDQT